MKKTLLTLHRWLGFPIGLLFIVTFGTGALTAVDELIQRYEQGSFNAEFVYRQTSHEENAAAISVITEDRKGIGRLVMPTPETPYYQVATRGESWTHPIDDLASARHQESHNEGFFNTVLQLHRNLLLGREGLWGVEGKVIVAWSSLISLALSLLGFWLWWPRRRIFKARQILPQGTERKHFYVSHMSSGVVVLAAIVLLALTGASITYRSVVQGLLGIERDAAPTMDAVQLDDNWEAWLTAAQAHMPEGAQLTQIRYPRQRGKGRQNEAEAGSGKPQPKVLDFVFLAPGDWLGMAASRVSVDQTHSRLTKVSLFSERSFAEKVFSILVPLHTGHHLNAAYTVLLLLMSLLGFVMVFSGLVSFVTKKRYLRKRFERSFVNQRGNSTPAEMPANE